MSYRSYRILVLRTLALVLCLVACILPAGAQIAQTQSDEVTFTATDGGSNSHAHGSAREWVDILALGSLFLLTENHGSGQSSDGLIGGNPPAFNSPPSQQRHGGPKLPDAAPTPEPSPALIWAVAAAGMVVLSIRARHSTLPRAWNLRR